MTPLHRQRLLVSSILDERERRATEGADRLRYLSDDGARAQHQIRAQAEVRRAPSSREHPAWAHLRESTRRQAEYLTRLRARLRELTDRELDTQTLIQRRALREMTDRDRDERRAAIVDGIRR